jgi:hypothetical protein
MGFSDVCPEIEQGLVCGTFQTIINHCKSPGKTLDMNKWRNILENVGTCTGRRPQANNSIQFNSIQFWFISNNNNNNNVGCLTTL